MKKRKAESVPADASCAKKMNGDTAKSSSEKVENDDHIPLTLDEIRVTIKDLSSKVPVVPPEGINEKDSTTVREWAQVSLAVM